MEAAQTTPSFQLKCGSYPPSLSQAVAETELSATTMATIPGSVTSKKQLSERNEALKQIRSEAFKFFTFLKFSNEDSELHPPTCKQHIWQQILLQAVKQAAKLSPNYPTLRLMHGLLPYTPMELVTFSMDAAYRSTQFSTEELSFLRKIRLEQFLCNVPWGVVHAVRAREVIDTLQEDTMQVTLKGEVLPLFSEDWRALFLKIFHLAPKGEGERGKLQLSDLFPSLATIQEGQKSVKIGDCKVAGSKRPLRLLSSFFCLNTSGQYSITIHFAELLLTALNGEKVDWPLEFFDEFKAEILTLHRHQQADKAKVIRTAIGPHLTLMIEEANLLGTQERKLAGFGTSAGLTMTERVPPPRKRKLGEASGSGKLDTVVRVTPHPSRHSSNHTHVAHDTDSEGEPPKRRVLQAAEKWEVPDDTSSMINQICFTHRRLEQLLTTFTSKAGSEFIKTMDAEFHKIQQEATQQFKQNLREKEALTDNEHAVGKSLLQIEIRKLTVQLAALNESYDEQIEMSFDLQDKLTTAEEALATLTETNRTQQVRCNELTTDLDRQNNRLAAVEAELEATNEQFTELQLQHQRQSDLLATTEEQLRQQTLASKLTSPDTPISEDQTPPASGSTVHAPTSGLHSMVEVLPNPKDHDRIITELKQELAYVRRERDELQVNMERIIESPRSFDEETLGSGYRFSNQALSSRRPNSNRCGKWRMQQPGTHWHSCGLQEK